MTPATCPMAGRSCPRLVASRAPDVDALCMRTDAAQRSGRADPLTLQRNTQLSGYDSHVDAGQGVGGCVCVCVRVCGTEMGPGSCF